MADLEQQDLSRTVRTVMRLVGLFSVPFIGIAVWLLVWGIGPTLQEWDRMAGWQPVQATVVSARLNTHPGRRGSTYSAAAEYRYEVDGRTYTGRRTSLASGSDSFGDYQARLARTLIDAQQQGRTVQVWVDPTRPADAIVDRELRADLIAVQAVAALVFGGFGLFMGWKALQWRRALRSADMVLPPPSHSSHVPSDPASPPAAQDLSLEQRLRNLPFAPKPYSGVRVQPLPGGVELRLPYGRDWGTHLQGLLGGVAFCAMAVALYHVDRGQSVGVILFMLVFGLLGLALFFSGIFCLTNSLQVRIDRTGLHVQRRWLGLPIITHRALASEVKRLELKYEQTLVLKGREFRLYVLRAVLKNGRQIALTDSMRGEDISRNLLHQVLALSGYPR